jgi:general secretion pathway protein G
MKTQENADAGYFKGWAGKMTAKDTPDIFALPLKDHGFTLVELIIVCAVLAILTTLVIPTFQELSNKAKISKAKAEIRVIEKAISAYVIDNNRLPGQLSEIGAEANILDPWKNPYYYYNIGAGTGNGGPPRYTSWKLLEPNLNDDNDYDLYSNGADRATHASHKIPDPLLVTNACSDDIIRADNGSTVELASDY